MLQFTVPTRKWRQVRSQSWIGSFSLAFPAFVATVAGGNSVFWLTVELCLYSIEYIAENLSFKNVFFFNTDMW